MEKNSDKKTTDENNSNKPILNTNGINSVNENTETKKGLTRQLFHC